MKKVLFLTLFLMIFGAASVKAQVRIGGNGVPHGAAVLDLNADDANNGTKTLALPRVSLTSTADKMGNAALLGGMLVYNTAGGALSEGVYYWDGSQWVKPNSTAYTGSTSITLSGSEIRRAALTGDVTAAENDNVTTIADNSITSAKIVDGAVGTGELADGAVTGNKIDQMSAEAGDVLAFDGLQWAPAAASSVANGALGALQYLTFYYPGQPLVNVVPANCMLVSAASATPWYGAKTGAEVISPQTASTGETLSNPVPGWEGPVVTNGRSLAISGSGTKADYTTQHGIISVPVVCW